MATTLADKVIKAARGLSVTPINAKAWVCDTYAALVASGDVADGCLDDFKVFLVAMHRRGILTLASADLTPAFDPAKVKASTTRYWGSTYHFVRG